MEPHELDTVRARAEKYYAIVLEGVDFDSLAKAVSEDVTTAQRGGDLGYFAWGKMVDEFQEAAFALKVGEISEIIESEYGFHIIKMVDRRQNKDVAPFEQEEENIRMNLRRVYQQELGAAAGAYLEELKEEAGLWFDYANIQKILDKVSDPSVPRNQDYFSNFNEEERNWTIATIHSDTITVSKLAAETSKGGPPNWRDQKTIVQAVERIFLPDMLGDRASAKGLYNHENVKDVYKASAEMEMIRAVENKQVAEKIESNDDILHDYYKDHPNDFQIDGTVEVQEIYILVKGEDSKDEAYAEMVAKKAKSGQNFTKLVTKYNDRKSSLGREGKIGPITNKQYGAMGKAAFELEIGEIAGPIKMGARGYSIIKLLDKTPARVKPFDDCRPLVERAYKAQKTTELREAWMADLESQYAVTILDDKLMQILPQPESVASDTSGQKEKFRLKTVPIGEGQ